MSYDDYDNHYLSDGVYGNWEDPSWSDDDPSWSDAPPSPKAPQPKKDRTSGQYWLDLLDHNLSGRPNQKNTKEATQLIAALDNKVIIQNKIIKKLFHKNIDSMIIDYSFSEKVPIRYLKMAKENHCLKTLLAGYLKKVGNYSLTQEIIDEIDRLIEEISRNDDLEIAYLRVKKIQKFIHDKYDQKYGVDSHLHLPVYGIKCLLSIARLHLNISDFTYKDVNSLTYIINQSIQKSDAERENPEKVLLPNGKKHTKDERAGHMEVVIARSIYAKVNAILGLDKNLSINDFKKKVIDIYGCDY